MPSPSPRWPVAIGALLIVSGLVHLAILVTTGASWEGPLSWRKPMAFGFSFGVTVITIAWVSSFVRLSDRARAWIVGVFTIASAFETVLVSLQTWRGVPSHFNTETSIDAIVARSLAFGGAVLVLMLITLTIASFRANPAVPISMRVAIGIGFVALLGAQAVGGLMIAKGMSLVAAGHPQAAYATGGSLKPSHAITMHGIQLLPVAAWLLSFVDWPERRRLTVVLLAAAAYLVGVGAVISRILG
jgi:hypothetical protein